MTLISKWKFRWNKEAFDPSPAKIRGIGSRENAMEHIPYQLNHSSHSKICHKSIGLWQAVCKKLRPFKVDWCLCAWNSPRNEWFWFEVPKQYSNTPSTWLKFASLDAFLVHLFVPWNDSNLMVPPSLNPWEMSQKKDTQRFCQRWMVEARQCPKWMVFLCFSWAKTDFDLVRLRRSFLQLVAETLRRLSPEKRRESIARSPSQVGTILNVRNYDIKEDITKQSSHDLGFQ